MTNTKLLEEQIKIAGLKYSFIAKSLGITYQSLRKKMDNATEFTASEIDTLCKILTITTLEKMKEIFFTRKVDL